MQRSALLTDARGGGEHWAGVDSLLLTLVPTRRRSWSFRSQSESLQSGSSTSGGKEVPVCIGVSPQPSKPPCVNTPVDVLMSFTWRLPR